MDYLQEHQQRILQLCALTAKGVTTDPTVIAHQARHDQTLTRLYDGTMNTSSLNAQKTRQVIHNATSQDWRNAEHKTRQEIRAAQQANAQLVTILDDTYPPNLRHVTQPPPFLWYRGVLNPPRDKRSVAIIGSRRASLAGLRRCARLARDLAHRDVAVVSGLALGVDSTAHQATVVSQGRTVAVLPCGITSIYPQVNQKLSERILAGGGLIVSHFWPSQTPIKQTFRDRNMVTSGFAQGVAVIEAQPRSGTCITVRHTTMQHKPVWLLRSLVNTQSWARRMTRDYTQAHIVDHVDDITSRLV